MSYVQELNNTVSSAKEMEYVPNNAVRACAYRTAGQTVIRIRLADGRTLVHLPNYLLAHVGGGWGIPFRFVDMEDADRYLRTGKTKLDILSRWEERTTRRELRAVKLFAE